MLIIHDTEAQLYTNNIHPVPYIPNIRFKDGVRIKDISLQPYIKRITESSTPEAGTLSYHPSYLCPILEIDIFVNLMRNASRGMVVYSILTVAYVKLLDV